MITERKEQGNKQNVKGQVIAFIILIVLFVLQVPYTKSALADYKKDPSENMDNSAIIKSEVSASRLNENSSWQLLLVNQEHPLPKDFTVDLVKLPGNHRIDCRIAPELKKMFEAAKKDGVVLIVCSAFRTVDLQSNLYQKKVIKYASYGLNKTEAKEKAAAIVANAGASEHHTGLAVDIFASDYKTLDAGFEKTAAFAWLDKNAHNYGFILRYPKDKQDITGITYEPWHYRYVGAQNAKMIKEKKITLEEYLEDKQHEK